MTGTWSPGHGRGILPAMNPRYLCLGVLCALLWAGAAEAQSQPRSQPGDLAEPDPWEELDDARPARRDATLENVWLAGYSATVLGISPLAVSALQSDVTYGEGALLTAASSLGAASMVVGGTLFGGGVVVGYLGWLCIEIGVESPLLGIFLVPTGAVLMTLGIAGGLGGVALVLGAPVVTTGGFIAADGVVGERPDLSFGLTAAVTGGLVIGSFGGLLLISQSNADPWLQTVAVVVSGMFGATLAYGIFRHVDSGDGPKMLLFTPAIAF